MQWKAAHGARVVRAAVLHWLAVAAFVTLALRRWPSLWLSIQVKAHGVAPEVQYNARAAEASLVVPVVDATRGS